MPIALPHRFVVTALALGLASSVTAGQGAPAGGAGPQAQTPPPASAPAAPEAAAPQTAPAPRAQTPAFRANVDVVSLNVTVTDSTGRYVIDLDEPEFLVFENGVKQDLSFFSRRQHPIALSMLLDSSASMEAKLPTLQAAATTFIKRLKTDDMAQIVEFDGSVAVRQGFTSNQRDLERAIQMLHAGGSTSLHNAIYIALKEMKKAPASESDENPRRQALVVFSDGQDTTSLVTYEEVLDLAKRSETSIYTIGLRDLQDQARGFSQAEFVLRQGHEMGRPCRIGMQLRKQDDQLIHGAIGGEAVVVAEGVLDLGR